MHDKGLYNYYLKEVLGIQTYIGDQQSQVFAGMHKVLHHNKTVLLIEEELSDDENSLIKNIMKAVGVTDFSILESSNFVMSNYIDSTIIQFTALTENKSKYFIPQISNQMKMLVSCPLSEMLPPTDDKLIKENKQKLWSSLQKIFEV